MKLLTVISAGLVLAATSAQAQSPPARPPYTAASDVSGPYAAMPPARGPGYGPRLLPATEVYTVLRDNGFSPLGIPRQRGFFYMISVTNRRGDGGRLVIDARDGRIVRFQPEDRFGPGHGGPEAAYGPPGRIPPVGSAPRPDEVRPPGSVPKMASRTPSPVPPPKAEASRPGEMKSGANPLAEKPAPAQGQQSAANQVKPADAGPGPASPAPAPVEAKPSVPQQPEILPTQEMPKVQGFE